jgi:hypothetical protein
LLVAESYFVHSHPPRKTDQKQGKFSKESLFAVGWGKKDRRNTRTGRDRLALVFPLDRP